MKYLDLDRLQYFWLQIKEKLNNKVDKVDGKTLTANDLTDALKATYDAKISDIQVDSTTTIAAGTNASVSSTTSSGVTHLVFNIPQGVQGEAGVSGVYVGSGDMPEGYSVQIDPNGIPDTTVTYEYVNNLIGGVLGGSF